MHHNYYIIISTCYDRKKYITSKMTDNDLMSVTEQCWKCFREGDNKEEAERILEQVKEPQSMRDVDKYHNRTLLHWAALWGWLCIVIKLVQHYLCDPKCTANDGATPLHNACFNGNLDVVQYLITECKCDPMCQNSKLNTPLDIACNHSHYDVVEYLLINCNINSFFNPKFYFNKHHIKPLLDKFIKLECHASAVDSFVNIFLLGKSGTGKSTLTKVINMRENGGYWFGIYRSVSNVALHTAGIIPHTLQHKELGNIIIHDLAGQSEYYTSHSAVIENILGGSSAMFIIVVKLSDDPPYEWINLVTDLCSNCSSSCYLLTVASYADTIESESERLRLSQRLEAQILKYTANEMKLINSGIVYLDCRKLDSQQFTIFNDSLLNACQSIRHIIKMNGKNLMFSRMLYILLQSKGEKIYSLDAMFDLVQMSISEYFLPDCIEKLSETLRHLHHIGLIMFIETPKGSWVVVDKGLLLSEVNGTVFGQNFSQINTGQQIMMSYSKQFLQFTLQTKCNNCIIIITFSFRYYIRDYSLFLFYI